MSNCLICKLPATPDINCLCGAFVCENCESDGIMMDVDPWKDLQFMMTEEEARENFELIGEYLEEEINFKCPICYTKSIA